MEFGLELGACGAGAFRCGTNLFSETAGAEGRFVCWPIGYSGNSDQFVHRCRETAGATQHKMTVKE